MRTFFEHAFFSLGNRNFRLYFFGQLVSLAGSWMQAVALGWLAYEMTGSEYQLGIILGLSTFPIIFFGLFGGYIGTKFDNFKVAKNTQLILSVMPFLVSIAYYFNSVEIWMLYLASFWVGLIGAVDQPVRQGFMLKIVGKENLKNAISLFGTISSVARILGPLLAGLCMHFFGAGICFLLNGVSFVAMYFLINKMDVNKFHDFTENIHEKGVWDTFKYVYRDGVMYYSLMLGMVLGMFVYIFQTVFPMYAKTVFQGSVLSYSIMVTAISLGSIIGGIYGASIEKVSRRKIGNYGVLVAIFYGGLSFSPNIYVFLLLAFMMGFFLIQLTASLNSLLQINVREEYTHIVLSMWIICIIGMGSIGSFMVGALSEEYGVRIVSFLCASILFVASLYFKRKILYYNLNK